MTNKNKQVLITWPFPKTETWSAHRRKRKTVCIYIYIFFPFFSKSVWCAKPRPMNAYFISAHSACHRTLKWTIQQCYCCRRRPLWYSTRSTPRRSQWVCGRTLCSPTGGEGEPEQCASPSFFLDPPKAEDWTCSTVTCLCSASSPSCAGSETRSWLVGRWDWASATVAAASLCLCTRWKKILVPVLLFDIWNRDIVSCASSVHLGGTEEKGKKRKKTCSHKLYKRFNMLSL